MSDAQDHGYPATSGDVDPSQQVTGDAGPQHPSSGDSELDAALETVDGVRAYLADESTPEERRRRADAVADAEDRRPGDNRKGVMEAVDQARAG